MPAESINVRQAEKTYAIRRWGQGYVLVNASGHLCVRPDPHRSTQVDLFRLAQEIRATGALFPVLVRFIDILHDRIKVLTRAFEQVMKARKYQGDYTPVYPIKVNQQRSVVEQILAAGHTGLEAGSKPELIVVLALSRPGGLVICNGYKDREYIRLALIGQRLGLQVVIVIEKPSELELTLDESEKLAIDPLLGVRVRLAASAAGNWQNSGGERAKFGLAAGQLLSLVEQLHAANKLRHLTLLHAHLGSQIPNLRDIRGGLRELVQYYARLRELGAPISTVDVGGGLGVDYEGTQTRQYCSINYSWEDYAAAVVTALSDICEAKDLPHPNIITESGRALTAHHAVLITNVIDREAVPGDDVGANAADQTDAVLQALGQGLAEIDLRSPLEVYQDALHLLDKARSMFEQGQFDLRRRARAEALYYATCQAVKARLRPEIRSQRATLDQVNRVLSDKVFCNFSLFQSLPDVWAIEQIFPIVPLQRLNEPPKRRVVLHDLTCDSDGSIDLYVDQDGVEHSLPLHDFDDNELYLIGIFMLGAYQETLGDIHNLFGDTDTINLELDGNGGYRLSDLERGDAVDELLSYVHFDPRVLLQRYAAKLNETGVCSQAREQYLTELKAGLRGYTYHED